MNVSDIIQIVLASLTLIGVIVALITTSWSIRAQNKQSLFEKRLEIFILCKTFYNLVEGNMKYLDLKTEECGYPIDLNLEFSWITNTDYFEGAPRIINDIYNEDYRYRFLQKLEDLGFIAEKCTLLFKGNNGITLQRFILAYRDTLRSIYGYQIVLDKMRNDPIEKMAKEALASGMTKAQTKTAKELCKNYGEPEFRKDLLDKLSALKKAANVIKKDDSLNKIKEQLTL